MDKTLLISSDKTIRDALELLNYTAKKVLFVVEGSKLQGSISDGDIRRWILKSGDLDAGIENITNTKPVVLYEEDKRSAYITMKELGLTAIPVVDEDHNIINIYSWLADRADKAALNLPVVIMAGGKGERLKPYTNILPKPLIPIGEKPIIELIIESFFAYGCRDFYLSINYKRGMLKAFFDEVKREYSVNYIEEPKPLGTGGSLYYVKDKIEKTFFVSNCDILLDIDYNDVYQYHMEAQNIITIIASVVQYSVPYGVVKTDDRGLVTSIEEKPSNDYLVNTGVYIIEPDFLDYIQSEDFIHITDIIEMCIKDGKKVGTYPVNKDSWMDMGQMEDLENMKKQMEN